jgi:hypothetical protein
MNVARFLSFSKILNSEIVEARKKVLNGGVLIKVSIQIVY